jgi:hypothetical protein
VGFISGGVNCIRLYVKFSGSRYDSCCNLPSICVRSLQELMVDLPIGD